MTDRDPSKLSRDELLYELERNYYRMQRAKDEIGQLRVKQKQVVAELIARGITEEEIGRETLLPRSECR